MYYLNNNLVKDISSYQPEILQLPLRKYKPKNYDETKASLSHEQLFRGYDLYEKKQFKKSIKCYTKGIRLAPVQKDGKPVTHFVSEVLCDLHYCRALSHYKLQEYDAALDDFRECIKYNPEQYCFNLF